MPIDEKYIFTYEDYLETINRNSIKNGVAEESKEYKADEKEEQKIHQKHDKSFKDALSEPREMEFLLKEFIGIEEPKEKLQEYKNEFITKQYAKRQADIIYKNTQKEIYYIVEHQSSKDMEMPQRIVEYCLELMRDVTKDKMQSKEIYPTIVPIVLYTGEGVWNIETNFAERQKNSIGTYETYKIDIKYTVIDISKKNDKQNNFYNIVFIVSDMFENIQEKDFDIIVSNPPYIETDVIKTLPTEVRNEPIIALDGGKDALKYYKII